MTLDLVGDVPRYRRLRFSVRPARVAVLIPGGQGWEPVVLQTLEVLSRTWGGAGNILVPVAGGGVAEGFRRVLAAHDPDRLGYYQPTWRGRQLADPDAFDEWLSTQAEEWVASHGGTLEEARASLTADHMMNSPSVNLVFPEGLSEWVRARLAPIAPRSDVLSEVFQADQPPRGHVVDLARLAGGPGRLQVLRTEHLDPRMRLMVTARTGAMAPSYADALAQLGVTIEEIDVTDADLPGLLELCWRRNLTPLEWARARMFAAAQGRAPSPEALYTSADFLAQTPFGDSMRGCNWYTQTRSDWEDRPYYVVCGDSAADFCLALALDRCYGDGAWFPQMLAQAGDELADVVRTTLARVIDSIDSRPIVCTSMTADAATLEETLRSLPAEVVREGRYTVVESTRLPLGRPWRLLDRAQVERGGSQPFVGTQLAGDLPLLQPTEVKGREVWDCTWQVDVAVEGHQLPARWCLNSHLSPETHPWALLRSGADGISFYSHSMGFVVAGSSVEQALARPRLRVPDGREVFDALLRHGGLRCEDSAAGRYTQAAIDLWGSLEWLADALRQPFTRDLLRAYLSKAASNDSGIFLTSRDRRFLSFEQAGRASGTMGIVTRRILDAYVAQRVLRRGLILQCRRCGYADWYPLEALSQTFTCGRCQHVSLIVQAAWKQPEGGEPNWYYDLDEVVYQALSHDVAAPVLALSELGQGAESILVRPEADVYGEQGLLAEIDLWAIIDGQVVVGEAKTIDRLDRTRAGERRIAARLTSVAQAVTADQVVLATTAPAWNERSVAVMQEALERSGIPLRQLVDLGANSTEGS
jgi:hypothetical protein